MEQHSSPNNGAPQMSGTHDEAKGFETSVSNSASNLQAKPESLSAIHYPAPEGGYYPNHQETSQIGYARPASKVIRSYPSSSYIQAVPYSEHASTYSSNRLSSPITTSPTHYSSVARIDASRYPYQEQHNHAGSYGDIYAHNERHTFLSRRFARELDGQYALGSGRYTTNQSTYTSQTVASSCSKSRVISGNFYVASSSNVANGGPGYPITVSNHGATVLSTSTYPAAVIQTSNTSNHYSHTYNNGNLMYSAPQVSDVVGVGYRDYGESTVPFQDVGVNATSQKQTEFC